MHRTMDKLHHHMDHQLDAVPSRPLRIAISLPQLEPLAQVMRGEPAEATYIIQRYIAAGLPARGHRLTFVGPRSFDDLVCTHDPQKPSPAPRTWSAGGWFNLASNGIWRVQQRLGIPYLNVFSNYRLFDACLQCLPGHDLVYERNGMYRDGVAKACQRLKLPYILYVEADDILEHDYMGKPITGLLRWRAKETMRYNLNAADCVICVSEPLKTHLTSVWGVPEEKIVVFANVADVQRFRPDPQARAETRASLGINANPVILFVGAFYEWHDVATLLDAFAQVLAAQPEARLVLVGEGTQRQAMMQRATDLGIMHAVQFTGFMTHTRIPGLVAAADIAAAPYPPMQQDLWLSPLKLFEYMASGTAIIASEVGQIAQVIQDNRNGLLVPPGDAAAMAAALQKLIANPALRLQLGRQAREDAVHKHSWEHYLSRLERLFEAVLAGQPVDHI